MTGYSECYYHRSDLAEVRRLDAKKGGKRGGRGRPGLADARDIQVRVREVIDGVLSGKIEKGVGSVCFMGFNSLLRAVEVERKIKETEELEERIEGLEQAVEAKRWGA